jgi:hypothetical protein
MNNLVLIILVFTIFACKHRGTQSQVKNAPRRALSTEGNPSHYEGPFVIKGPWNLKSQTQENLGVPAVKYFGTMSLLWKKSPRTPVKTFRGSPKIIRDMHYVLSGGSIGIKPIPVTDGGAAQVGGQTVRGSELMDTYLRETMGLGERDAIFSLIAYSHPEEYEGEVGKLPKLKTENGQTHMGAYIGSGRTRNAPLNYHNKKWGITQGSIAYPATVNTIKLSGVPFETTNKNLSIIMEIMNQANGGVKFAEDYKFDHFKTWNLKEALRFYEIWVTQEQPALDNLLADAKNWLYCAEHITLVANLGLNVPMSEKGHVAIWGSKGRQIYKAARERYREVTGRFPEAVGFAPLWKKSGVRRPAQESAFGVGVPWAPETTADLIANYLQQYASWVDVGSTVSAAVILGFMEETVKRMKISQELFLKLAGEAITKIVAFEAQTIEFADRDAFSSHQQDVKSKLKKIVAPLGAAGETLIVAPAMAKLKSMMSQVVGRRPLAKESVYDKFLAAIKGDMARFREVEVGRGQGKAVRYYTPPAILHRIASGMHPSHKLVDIKPVATAFRPQDVVYTGRDWTDSGDPLYPPRPLTPITGTEPIGSTLPPQGESSDTQTEDREDEADNNQGQARESDEAISPPIAAAESARKGRSAAGDRGGESTSATTVRADQTTGSGPAARETVRPAVPQEVLRPSQIRDNPSHCNLISERRACDSARFCGWSYGVSRCINVTSSECRDYPDSSWCSLTRGCEWRANRCQES